MAKKPWPVMVGEYTSLAFLLPVCTGLGYAIGYLLDGEFGTTWIRFVGVVVGTAAGFVQLIRQLMQDTKDEPAPDDPNKAEPAKDEPK